VSPCPAVLERDKRFLVDGIVLCELVWVLETGYGFSRREIAATLEKVLATAQFEIESKDLAVAALDDFRRSAADFSDCLLGRRNRAAGATETVTFDRGLGRLVGFRLL
jgi:predicted nucleic-acid-binding protein